MDAPKSSKPERKGLTDLVAETIVNNAKDGAICLGSGIFCAFLPSRETNNTLEIASATFWVAGLLPLVQASLDDSANFGNRYVLELKKSPARILMFLTAYNLTQLALYGRM